MEDGRSPSVEVSAGPADAKAGDTQSTQLQVHPTAHTHRRSRATPPDEQQPITPFIMRAPRRLDVRRDMGTRERGLGVGRGL